MKTGDDLLDITIRCLRDWREVAWTLELVAEEIIIGRTEPADRPHEPFLHLFSAGETLEFFGKCSLILLPLTSRVWHLTDRVTFHGRSLRYLAQAFQRSYEPKERKFESI